MLSVNSISQYNNVAFGRKSYKESDTQSDNRSSHSGAKVLGALAIAGAATWGAIQMSKKGNAARKDYINSYFLNKYNLRDAMNQKSVADAKEIVKEMNKVNKRTSKVIHLSRKMALERVDWDAKPMTREELLNSMK